MPHVHLPVLGARQDEIVQRTAEARLEDPSALIVTLIAAQDRAVVQIDVEDLLRKPAANLESTGIQRGRWTKRSRLTFGAWLTIAKRESSEIDTEVSSCG